jgi:hypothetical protein
MRSGLRAVAPAPLEEERRSTTTEVAAYWKTNRCMVEQWVADGCPADNIAGPHKKKRLLRFSLAEVAAWHRSRS